jgi:signal peptidase I
MKASKLLIVFGSLGSILIIALIASVPFFISSYKVPQDGMYPTIHAGGRIFVYRRPYSDASRVRRGEVIVFVRTQEGKRYNYIWRVIGIPGDKITVEGDKVILNGQPLKRKNIHITEKLTIYQETIDDTTFEVAYDSAAPPSNRLDASMVVPPDEFFVLGDNRYNAVDSRYFGCVPFKTITGRMLF